jgi:hypothetical protein
MIRERAILLKRLFTIVLLGVIIACCTENVLAQSQSIPACFATPPMLAANGSFVLPNSPLAPCEELDELLLATSPKETAWISGAGVNAIIGIDQGGFAPNSYAVEFRVTPQFNTVFAGPVRDELVRFAGNEAAAEHGAWWTTLESVTSDTGGLVDASTVEDSLALPPGAIPHVIAYSSRVVIGTIGYFGIVSPAFTHSGGAVQFWFPPGQSLPKGPVYSGKTQVLQQ